jgi:hypothetical protein
MTTDDGQDAFMKFLATEFSQENLDFFRATEKVMVFWDAQPSEDKKKKWVKRATSGLLLEELDYIITHYVEDNAQEEVNLPSGVHDSVLKKFDGMIQIEDDTAKAQAVSELIAALKEAQTEIKNLLYTDSFRRFTKSDFYKTMIEKRKMLSSGGRSQHDMQVADLEESRSRAESRKAGASVAKSQNKKSTTRSPGVSLAAGMAQSDSESGTDGSMSRGSESRG